MARSCGVVPRTIVMKLYRLLLHLYPSSYRADYGDEMCADFEQELRLSSGVLVEDCGSGWRRLSM